MKHRFPNLSAPPLVEALRAGVFVENKPQTNNKLRQERRSLLFDRPAIYSVQKTSLLTELGKSSCDCFYKYAAPAALMPVTPPPIGDPVSTFQHFNASTIAAFFLNHRGRCFDGWTTGKIFNYTLVNCVRRNVFAARDRFGLIAFAAIAWLDDAARIKDLDARGLPQFEWEPEKEHPKGWTPNGDSILIADVAGDRKFMPEILKQVNGAWPDSPRKKLFTYRRGKLVELSWQTVFRFAGLNEDRRARSAGVPPAGSGGVSPPGPGQPGNTHRDNPAIQ